MCFLLGHAIDTGGLQLFLRMLMGIPQLMQLMQLRILWLYSLKMHYLSILCTPHFAIKDKCIIIKEL